MWGFFFILDCLKIQNYVFTMSGNMTIWKWVSIVGIPIWWPKLSWNGNYGFQELNGIGDQKGWFLLGWKGTSICRVLSKVKAYGFVSHSFNNYILGSTALDILAWKNKRLGILRGNRWASKQWWYNMNNAPTVNFAWSAERKPELMMPRLGEDGKVTPSGCLHREGI